MILSWMFFFGARIVISVMTVVCSSVAVALLIENSDSKRLYDDNLPRSCGPHRDDPGALGRGLR